GVGAVEVCWVVAGWGVAWRAGCRRPSVAVLPVAVGRGLVRGRWRRVLVVPVLVGFLRLRRAGVAVRGRLRPRRCGEGVRVRAAGGGRGGRPGEGGGGAGGGRRAAAAGREVGGGRGNGRAGGGNPLTGTSGSRGRRGGASHGRPHGGLSTPGKPTSPGGRTGNSRSGNGGTGPLTGKQRGAHRSPKTGSDGLTPAERAAARRAHRAVAAPRTLAGRAADRARRWAYSRLSRTRSGRMLLRGGRAAGWLVAGVTRLCARAATWSWKKLSPHARAAWTWLASA